MSAGFNPEMLLIVKELGEVIRLHNETVERMVSFRTTYPHLVPPNLAKMVEENLKENVSVLYRELNNVNKPAEARRRHVCRDCHNVFVVPLPGGICDECRSKIDTAGSDPYRSRPHKPETESETVVDLTPTPDEAIADEELDEAADTEGFMDLALLDGGIPEGGEADAPGGLTTADGVMGGAADEIVSGEARLFEEKADSETKE